MSKQRRIARAERERLAAERAAAREAEQRRAAAGRARRERRSQLWRRLRLWQHGPRFRRERWGALATLVLVVLVAVFVGTRSVTLTVVTALVLLVATPVLLMLFNDRSRR